MRLDDSFSNRQMIDIGTVLGYLVLAAYDFGLGSCPIGLVADYADEVRDLLNIPENKKDHAFTKKLSSSSEVVVIS